MFINKVIPKGHENTHVLITFDAFVRLHVRCFPNSKKKKKQFLFHSQKRIWQFRNSRNKTVLNQC